MLTGSVRKCIIGDVRALFKGVLWSVLEWRDRMHQRIWSVHVI